MPNTDINFMTAVELAQHIRSKELSCAEVMKAHLDQIDRVNPKVNAIVTYQPERALEGAKAADESLQRGDDVGVLHGLPVAHKDLVDTAGVRTTYGSPIYVDHIPEQDALMVERLKQAGAISVGKTNTPEFGAGSQTFNEVFGATLNPYDLTKTCGGSSGGAAVALACGMVPIADGSDLGGSLRNPSNFCNIVGFRTAIGRVPVWPSQTPWSALAVQGPMARTVQDAALMLSAITGPDERCPVALTDAGEIFNPLAHSLERDFDGVRIAWSSDIGGLPVDPRIVSVIESQRGTFGELGCDIDEACPDFSGANEAFMVSRAAGMAATRAEMLETHRDQIKDTVIWNIEEGLRLSAADVGRAEVKRAALYERVHKFMETYEFMVFPVSQHPPFDVTQPYLTEVNGVQMETYIDWMRSCYYITATGLPAISVPCGFTEEGLPVGVQIVGRHQSEFSVLQLAFAFQQATGVWKQRPEIAV
ncbi:MAG: amidase [Chloroflexi bacterium]|nr:amidase [Chloroflexota bacterium]